jgi:18S rRNA (adenine1779-N6/adenine1780-N6)-dimethyltransferase
LLLDIFNFVRMELPYFDVCVANIPYQISSPLIFKLLAHRPFHRYSVLMLQREFAMRLIAQPGSELYCRLSVNAKALARVSHLMKVSRNSFRPPPKVDSSVVRIEPRNPPPPGNFLEWDGLLRICFQRKNKTLGSIMKQNAVLSLLSCNAKKLQMMQTSSTQVAIPMMMMTEDEEEETTQIEQQDEVVETEELKEMKEKIMKLLDENNFSLRRASKMTLDDFRCLLKTLNEAGIHFC